MQAWFKLFWQQLEENGMTWGRINWGQLPCLLYLRIRSFLLSRRQNEKQFPQTFTQFSHWKRNLENERRVRKEVKKLWHIRMEKHAKWMRRRGKKRVNRLLMAMFVAFGRKWIFAEIVAIRESFGVVIAAGSVHYCVTGAERLRMARFIRGDKRVFHFSRLFCFVWARRGRLDKDMIRKIWGGDERRMKTTKWGKWKEETGKRIWRRFMVLFDTRPNERSSGRRWMREFTSGKRRSRQDMSSCEHLNN